ncbi:hypothetical protein [Arthrobacter halodurans]|uniref:Uncharacterized protein n=1 Tax=Arthrobacter halodurans TaxID=516699 RepID=A0ABV4UQA1_9MICC
MEMSKEPAKNERRWGAALRRKEEIGLSHSELRDLARRRQEAEEKLDKHLREQEALHPPKHPHDWVKHPHGDSIHPHDD